MLSALQGISARLAVFGDFDAIVVHNTMSLAPRWIHAIGDTADLFVHDFLRGNAKMTICCAMLASVLSGGGSAMGPVSIGCFFRASCALRLLAFVAKCNKARRSLFGEHLPALRDWGNVGMASVQLLTRTLSMDSIGRRCARTRFNQTVCHKRTNDYENIPNNSQHGHLRRPARGRPIRPTGPR